MDTRHIRKAAAAILAVALIGGALSYNGGSPLFGTALTANAEETASTVSFDEETGLITLSGEVIRSEVLKYRYNKNVNKVVALEGTKLPADCSSLFAYFHAKDIDLSEADTSAVTNMGSMFASCEKLVTLDISRFNTSNVTNMGHMFDYDSALTSLDLSHFDTSNVKSMTWMFHGCSGLTSLDITNFQTGNVTDMSYFISDCKKLTSIDLSRLETHKVTNFGNMFDGASGLTSLDVSSFKTSSATNMYGMFMGCSGLTSLDISNFDTSNVTNMTHMFSKSTKLTEIDLGNLDTSKVEHMEYMFNGCSSLTSLDLGSFNTSSVTNMYSMFNNCRSLETLDLRFNTSNVTNMGNMFSGCNNLQQLRLHSFDTSNVTGMGYMFNGCYALHELDLKNFNTVKVKDMNHMFNDCSMLYELDLSSFDTTSVVNMNSMFANCTHLEKLDVSSFRTPSVTNMNAMFLNCASLQQLDLSEFEVGSNTGKTNMLKGCDKLSKRIVAVSATSATLNSSIGLNFFITRPERLDKIVISGPNGDMETNLSDCEWINGYYKITYPLNASQGSSDVTMKAYDYEGNRLIVANTSNGLLDHSQSSTNLELYLTDVLENETLSDEVRLLANRLRLLCVAADGYFNGAIVNYARPNIAPSERDFISDKKMIDETGKCKISVVLNSDTAIRIYYDGDENTADLGGNTLTAKTGKYGKYFEIPAIAAHQLFDDYTITIGGKSVTFSTMSYVQRVLDKGDIGSDLYGVCEMLYAYGKAAYDYNKSLKETT